MLMIPELCIFDQQTMTRSCNTIVHFLWQLFRALSPRLICGVNGGTLGQECRRSVKSEERYMGLV
jgi:hypothetical protein